MFFVHLNKRAINKFTRYEVTIFKSTFYIYGYILKTK